MEPAARMKRQETRLKQMTIREVYERMGADYEAVLRRLPSEALIGRLLLKFPEDDTFRTLKKALEEKDAQTAFRAAHTLKGVCQNLGFDNLFQPVYDLTEALRGGSLQGSDELMPPVEKQYDITMKAIRDYEASQQ